MTNPNDIIQNIIVRIQDDLQNANKSVAYLKEVSAAAKSAELSVKGYSAASGESVKSISKMQKAAYAFGSAVKFALAPISLLADAVKVLISVGSGLAAMMADAGKELTAFAAATGRGSDVTIKLRNSYKELIMSGQKVVLTIKDIAAAMTQFGQQGFAQLQMASEKPMQDFISGLQNALSKGLGSTDFGSELTQSVTKAFSNNLVALRSFESQWLAAGQDLAKQQEAIAQFRWVDDALMSKAIGSIQNLRDQAAGVSDPAVAANLSWSEFGNQLLVLLNQIQQEITRAFGTDMSGLISKLGDSVKDVIVWIQDAWKELRVWGAVAKVVWNWISEGAVISFKLVESSFLTLISALLHGYAKLSGFLGFEDTAKRAGAAAETAAIDAGKAFDRVMTPQFLSMTDEMAKAMMEVPKIAQKLSTPLKDTQQVYDKISIQLNNIRDRLLPIIQETKNWKESLDQAASSLSTTSQMLEIMGNNIKIGDKNLSDMVQTSFSDAIRSSKQLISESEKGLPLAEEQLKIAREQYSLDSQRVLDLKKAGASTEEITNAINKQQASSQRLNKFISERNDLLGNILHAHQSIKNAQEQALAPYRANLTILGAQKDLQQSMLEISKALYGTPALGVEAIRRVVDLMQQEKEELQSMLEAQRKNVQEMISQGIAGNELLNAKKLELDLQKQIADKTSQQLNMLKELRDGYIEAVQASAFASGKFEKIIITQEQNIAMAMEKGIAKRNYLLGQVGKEAQASNRAPVRFSASGMGVLETLDGQSVDLAKYSQEAINNIGDPVNRAASQQGLDAITGIYKGVQGAQIKASVGNTTAIKENTDAINNLIAARAAAIPMLGLKGTAAGGVVAGEAARQAGEMKNQRKKAEKIEKAITKRPAAAQESYFTDASPHGLVTKNLNPVGGKEAADLKKIREKNAKLLKAVNSRKISIKAFREGIRKHWEAHSRTWNQNKPNTSSGISSIDTIARKTDKGFVPETKTGKTLTHGTKNRPSGGGTFTRMISNVAELLITAGEKIRDIGPVIDEMDTQDPEVTTSPSGLSGEMGQTGAPG